MKTPDEIKKGLECCTPVWAGNHWKTCNSNCPYIGLADSCRGQLVYDALAYIQQLEAKIPQWISVEERLPEEADEVLVFCRNGETTWTNLAHRVGKQWWRVGVPMQCVTHWMPLPEPPKGEV